MSTFPDTKHTLAVGEMILGVLYYYYCVPDPCPPLFDEAQYYL